MGVDSIGSQTSGSYGVPKNNISAVTNESSQYVSEEHNRKVLGLIASETAIGTTVSPAVGSHERRINDNETAIAALEAVRDNDPPVLIAAGTIAGTNEVGETLTFSPSTFFNATTRDRQWQKDSGSGFADIGTEDGLTYVVVGIDAGTAVRCHEDGINGNGPTPANSNAITVKPYFNVAPTLVNDTSGTFPAVQGDVLSVDISGLLGSTSETYQWLDTNGVAIPGADQPTYTVDTGETGDGVSCLVTATNAGGPTPATTAEEAVTSGAWRDDVVGIQDDWPAINTTGDVLVSGDLDQWVGRFSSWPYQAPSAPQRPTDTPERWDFDRSNSQLMESANASLLALVAGTNPWTMAVRFTIGSMDANQVIWSFGDVATDAIYFQILTNGQVRLIREANDVIVFRALATSVVPGSVVTLVGRYDGDQLSLAFDGGTPSNISGATESMPSLPISRIGANFGGTAIFDGIVHECLITNVAASDAGMTDLHTNLATDYPD